MKCLNTPEIKHQWDIKDKPWNVLCRNSLHWQNLMNTPIVELVNWVLVLTLKFLSELKQKLWAAELQLHSVFLIKVFIWWLISWKPTKLGLSVNPFGQVDMVKTASWVQTEQKEKGKWSGIFLHDHLEKEKISNERQLSGWKRLVDEENGFTALSL